MHKILGRARTFGNKKQNKRVWLLLARVGVPSRFIELLTQRATPSDIDTIYRLTSTLFIRISPTE